MRTIATCICGEPMTPGSTVCRECYWDGVRAEAMIRPPVLCSEPDCTTVVKARGLCESHYKQWRRNEFAPRCHRCEVRPVTTRGKSNLCFECYQLDRSERRAELGCAVSECPDPHAAKGFCKSHYMSVHQSRQTKYHTCADCGEPCVSLSGRCRPCRDAFNRGRERDQCIRDGCDDPIVARGLCKSHYEGQRTKGGPWRIWAGRVLRGSVRKMPCQSCGYADTVVDVHRLIPATGYVLGNIVAVCPNCHRKIHLAGATPPAPVTAADLDTFSTQ